MSVYFEDKLMLEAAIPVIHVSDSTRAESFYCGQLGFSKQWENRPGSGESSPAYLGLQRDGVWIHVSSFSGDGVSGAVTAFVVADLDALFDEFKNKGVQVDLEAFDQTWGSREMYLCDPDGNKLRFVQGK